jgi:ABC-2 type transport system permease protein
VVRTSVGSNVLTYGTIMVQLILIPVLYALITSIMGAYYNPNGPPLANTEPFVYATGIILAFQPLLAMIFSEGFLLTGDPLFIYTSTHNYTGSTMPGGHTILIVSPWLLFCIEAVLLSALLVLFSIRLVQPVRYGRGSGIGSQRPVAEVPIPVGPNLETHGDASVPDVETHRNTPVR